MGPRQRRRSRTVLVREAFVRSFANGKALGSYAGLTATPYSSGGIEREQGIGKSGNRRLRTVMVELAWLWQRYQPGAAQVAVPVAAAVGATAGFVLVGAPVLDVSGEAPHAVDARVDGERVDDRGQAAGRRSRKS